MYFSCNHMYLCSGYVPNSTVVVFPKISHQLLLDKEHILCVRTHGTHIFFDFIRSYHGLWRVISAAPGCTGSVKILFLCDPLNQCALTKKSTGYLSEIIKNSTNCVSQYLHTHNKKHANHGRRPPRPLSPSVAVFRQFRRNASTQYIVGGALIARFLFFREGG